MTDFYVMLGLLRTASQEEVRAAYLARMKVLHPDRHSESGDAGPSAADLNLAYWTLRDPARRAAYDEGLTPRPPARRRRTHRHRPHGSHASHGTKAVVAVRKSVRKRTYYPRRSAYSGRTRFLVSIGFVLVAAAGAVASLTILRPERASNAWAGSAALVEEDQVKRSRRRALDDVLAGAAATEFQTILHRAGFSGASLYGQQCFEELAVQPNIAMADYCLAFDRTASEWESSLVLGRTNRRYFDTQARLARYQRLADRLGAGPVRSAIAAEAAYLNDDF